MASKPTSSVQKSVQSVIRKAGLQNDSTISFLEPLNEDGLKELFRTVAPYMGIEILVDTEPFPDMIVRKDGKAPINVELEYRLSDFLTHDNHHPEACQAVVCWVDDRVELKETYRGTNTDVAEALVNDMVVVELREEIHKNIGAILRGLDEQSASGGAVRQ